MNKEWNLLCGRVTYFHLKYLRIIRLLLKSESYKYFYCYCYDRNAEKW